MANNMKIAAIIAEYNPFHNGHKYHIDETRRITGAKYIAVIMSGNFVQRGEPAICDKFLRTKCALQNGADIVIELPFMFACQSSEYFSFGAVSLANKCGIIDSLCFGSESGDIESLNKAADIVITESSGFKAALKENLGKGEGFVSARAKAIRTASGLNFELALSNDILAVDYLKALKRLGSPIRAYTVKRKDNAYNSAQLSGGISSATSVRREIFAGNLTEAFQALPENCCELIKEEIVKGYMPVGYDELTEILRYRLLFNPAQYLSNIVDVSEGMENRIISKLSSAESISKLVSLVKTKRYTHSRIQRALLNIILDIKKSDHVGYKESGPQYIRVLGFRRASSELLHELTARASLPVITNLSKASVSLSSTEMNMLKKELTLTDIYNACMKKKDRKKGYEYSQPLIVI